MPLLNEIVLIVVVVLVLLSLPVLYVLARIRWLIRLGGTFECSARPEDPAARTGWHLGLARYVGDDLEWFRYYAPGFGPALRMRRHAASVLGVRNPDQIEALSLLPGHRVVRLDTQSQDTSPVWELAMLPDAVTGLLSWLEAAPPGQRPRGAQSPDTAV